MGPLKPRSALPPAAPDDIQLPLAAAVRIVVGGRRHIARGLLQLLDLANQSQLTILPLRSEGQPLAAVVEHRAADEMRLRRTTAQDSRFKSRLREGPSGGHAQCLRICSSRIRRRR